MTANPPDQHHPPQRMPVTDWQELPLVFDCQGETLVGLITAPAAHRAQQPGLVALLVVVGGPQYRVGAHRQFVELARHVAAAGHVAMRFDARGMGDSTGNHPGFEHLDVDIASAIDALQQQHPRVRRVVLWGLCDGASASALYLAEQPDARVAALSLLNPWVRGTETLARAQLRHWYVQRLLQPSFWRKLLRGGVGLQAARRLLANTRHGLAKPVAPVGDFRARMLAGAQALDGPLLVHLAERDGTAQEFAGLLSSTPGWRRLQADGRLRTVDLPEADHTLTAEAARRQLAQDVTALLDDLAKAP